MLQPICIDAPLPRAALRTSPQSASPASPSPSCVCSVHPDIQGPRVLAELLIHPLARAVLEVAAGLQPKRRADPRLDGMPPPMIPNSAQLASSTCFMLVSSLVAGCCSGQWPAEASRCTVSDASHWHRPRGRQLSLR